MPLNAHITLEILDINASFQSFGRFTNVMVATGIIDFMPALFFSDAGFIDNLAIGEMLMIFGPVVWVFAAFLTLSKKEHSAQF